MYRILITILIYLSLTACRKQQQEQTYSKKEFHRTVDSQFKITSRELSKESKRDYELRKRIEIKPKVDEQLYGIPQASPDKKKADSAKAIFEKYQ